MNAKKTRAVFRVLCFTKLLATQFPLDSVLTLKTWAASSATQQNRMNRHRAWLTEEKTNLYRQDVHRSVMTQLKIQPPLFPTGWAAHTCSGMAAELLLMVKLEFYVTSTNRKKPLGF